jgi:hypothetical protein
VRRHRANHVAADPSAAHDGQPGASRRGRPSKFTGDRVQRLLAAIRAGNTLRAAAMYAGITEDTVANPATQFFGFFGCRYVRGGRV